MVNLALDIEKVTQTDGDGVTQTQTQTQTQTRVESMFLKDVNNFARQAVEFLRIVGQAPEQRQRREREEARDQQSELRDFERNNQGYYQLVEREFQELEKIVPHHLRVELFQAKIDFAHANRMALLEKNHEARQKQLEAAHNRLMAWLEDIQEKMKGSHTVGTEPRATTNTGTASSSNLSANRSSYTIGDNGTRRTTNTVAAASDKLV